MNTLTEILQAMRWMGGEPGDKIAWLRKEDAEYWEHLNRIYKDIAAHRQQAKSEGASKLTDLPSRVGPGERDPHRYNLSDCLNNGMDNPCRNQKVPKGQLKMKANRYQSTATAAVWKAAEEKRAIKFVYEKKMSKIQCYSTLLFTGALIALILYNIVTL